MPIAPSVSASHPTVSAGGIAIIGLWCLYVLTAPLYVFESGLPQPADMIVPVLALALLPAFLSLRPVPVPAALGALALYLCVVAGVNGLYTAHYGDARFVYATAYAGFNAVIFAVVLYASLMTGDRFVTATRTALIAALAIQAGIVLVMGAIDSARATGSFNNPNQLGYWALLAGGCLIVLQELKPARIPLLIGAFAAIGFLIVQSHSRAALAGFGILLMALAAGPGVGILARVALFGVMSAGALAVVAWSGDWLLRGETGWSALLAERGYDRLWAHPEYLVFGAGEGAYWRFAAADWPGMGAQGGGLELHSGLAAVLFAYGIAGLGALAAFIGLALRKAPPAVWIALAALMVYGLTHQNIRFSEFWVFLGLAAALSHKRRKYLES